MNNLQDIIWLIIRQCLNLRIFQKSLINKDLYVAIGCLNMILTLFDHNNLHKAVDFAIKFKENIYTLYILQ